jgi:tetratricopeptide (TPR) repeat protein
MLRRAQALAPQEPWTRGLELEQQLRANNYERAAILAENIIRDGVENRGGAFNLAVVGYLSAMIELDRAGVAAEFFESINPGITTKEYVPTGLNELFMQFNVIQALLEMDAFETANAILTRLMTFADQIVPAWRDDDFTMVNVAIAQGNREEAIDYALRDLEQPLGRQLDWSFRYQHVAWLKPLLTDQRVSARIAELEAETREAGAEVRAMLAENVTR